MLRTSNSAEDQNIKRYKFTELFDMSEIQKLQDLFSKVTGVASIITEPNGTPITKPSGFCTLCNEIVRKTENGLRNCLISDSIIGSPKQDGPKIQRCLSGGLMDGGSSIIVQGVHIANWLIGQVLDKDYDIEDLLPYADIIGADKIAYKNELLKVKSMSNQQFENICDFLFIYAQQLSNSALKNISNTHQIIKLNSIQNDLKLREQILIESQKIAHIGSYILDFKTGIWNNSLELDKIFGINKKYCRTIKGWLNIVDSNWQKSLSEYIIQIQSEKSDFDFKYKIIRINDKEERWVHGLGELEFDEHNNAVRLIGTIQDITEQKLIEDTLRMSEENLRITLESIGDGVITTDINQNVQILNNVAKEMTGWSHKEALGTPFLDVFNISHENQNLTINNPVQEVMETNKICQLANHAILTSKDGSRRNIADSAAPIKDVNGNTRGVVMVFRDVTEKKRMNERLQKYQVLVENANDAMLFLDREGNILEANDAAIRIYGYTFKEFSSLNIYNLRHVEKSPFIIDQMDKADKNGFIFETIHYLKDGSHIDVEVSSQGTFLGEKRVLLSIIRDITERKKAEKEITYLSYHDQLTGLYNRRFYEEELKRLDTKRNLPITLVMADVNGLKLSNDAFGHRAGDVLLCKIANILKRECRSDEIVARTGGDEFVFLLPQTNAKDADKIVQRINEAISNEKTDNIILSISMGFAIKEDVSEDMNEVFKKAEDNMYRHKLSESSSIRSKTIDLIMNSLYEKNHREMLHSKRVSEICESIATKMGFEKDDINQIRIAGLMHDIGKIGINDNILNKVEKLTIEEWVEIKRHSEIGYRILSSVNEFWQISNYVLEHQERWDGKGYPKGLKGAEISIEARIIAVADSYDAMTSDRAYRKALSEEEAISEIRRCSGVQFDPEIATAFIEKVLGEN